MVFADSHTHLYLDAFANDIDEVMGRAIDKGVNYFFLPNIDRSSIQSLKDLCDRYPDHCHPMMGLHPTAVREDYREQLEIVEDELRKGKYCAVGEIGIDLYWDKTYLSEQEESFRRQIRIAAAMGLPVVIHSRDSFDEIFRIMDEEHRPGLTGIFHCFTGSAEQAAKIVKDYDFLLGTGGVITFRNSGLSRVVRDIPLKHLILETDSPYLSPVPYRGKRNESSYIPIIAEHLAHAKGIDVQEVARVTTDNALRIFGLIK